MYVQFFSNSCSIASDLHFFLPFQRDVKAAEGTPLKDLITTEPITGIKVMPHWLAQPYFRPSPEQKKAYGRWDISLSD